MLQNITGHYRYLIGQLSVTYRGCNFWRLLHSVDTICIVHLDIALCLHCKKSHRKSQNSSGVSISNAEISHQRHRKYICIASVVNFHHGGGSLENRRKICLFYGFPTFSDIFSTFSDIFRLFPTFSNFFRLFYTHDGIFRCDFGKWHHGGEEQNVVRISLNRCLSKAFLFCSWLKRKS